MIEWSLLAFGASDSIEAVVIAAPPGFEEEAERAAAAVIPELTVEAVAGGASRADSVRLAMTVVPSELVTVHDAARPLVTAELIDRVVGRLASGEADGVIAAAPVADTLKRGGEGDSTVAETVGRSGLWGAQTPQAFRAEALRAAQGAAEAAGVLAEATDEAWLLERVGGTVLLEAAGEPNPKVTDSADLALAAALLGAGSLRDG